MSNVDEKLQLALYEEIEAGHRLDNLNLFIYMMLLILTILTAWFFKHFRNRYIHETGLAVVYGLIIGVLIRETAPSSTTSAAMYDLSVNISQTEPMLPKRVILRMCPARNESTQNSCTDVSVDSLRYYEYTFSTVLQTPQKQEQFDLSSKATFDPEVFFNLILPAIIFHAGYSLKRRHFFVNIGAILLFAFFGTAISAVAIAAVIFAFCQIPYFSSLKFSFNDAMLFGSIISATDPVSVLSIFSDLGVDVDLHALILGESVLNDAVAIVLTGAVIGYRKASLTSTVTDPSSAEALAVADAFAKFFEVFLGAIAIGTATSLATALITKFTRLRDYPLLESSLFLLMSYSTFLAAEAASFSGIVALLFCGIFQAHYTYYNLSAESRGSLRYVTELLSFLAENFCFVQIGVTIFTFSNHYWDLYFILVAILAIIIGRAVNVYPLSFIMNRFARRKISYPFQHMMMFAGLRGAMAFALAIRDTQSQQQRVMFSTTLVLVIVTIIFCGALVTPLLQMLHIRVGVAMPPSTSSANFPSEQQRRRRSGSGEEMHDEGDGRAAEMQDRRNMPQSATRLGGSGRYDATSSNEFTALQPNTPSVMLAYASTSPQSTIDEMTIVTNENQVIDVVSSDTIVKPKHRYSSKVIRGWKSIDANYLKPLFTQCRPLLTETMPKNAFCQWIARILTTTYQFELGGIDDDGQRQNFVSSVDLGGPTPSPPHDNVVSDAINDTDDEPIMMDTDSPNIAGHSNNRKVSGSFTAATSGSR